MAEKELPNHLNILITWVIKQAPVVVVLCLWNYNQALRINALEGELHEVQQELKIYAMGKKVAGVNLEVYRSARRGAVASKNAKHF